MHNMHIIVATDIAGGIAKDGKIPWYCPADLAHFKRHTQHATLVVGRVTWDTLPASVKARDCIVMSRSPVPSAPRVVSSVDELLDSIGSSLFVYVIGGAQIYEALKPYCSTIIQTVVPSMFGCDKFFTVPPEFALSSTMKLHSPTWSANRVDIFLDDPYVKLYNRA